MSQCAHIVQLPLFDHVFEIRNAYPIEIGTKVEPA